MTTAIAAARERHIARALELATALGHDICLGLNRTECGRCLKTAVRPDLSYGPAAAEPCPPLPVSTWNPNDDEDTGQAYYLRLTAARQRLGLIFAPPP